MNFGIDKRLSPAERFVIYFEQAKFNYEISNDVNKATQKSILEWYNKKYNASLSEASLSKYLRGTNEIPVEVYVNMKELAGVKDLYYGMGASRKDFEISSDFKESLGFVSEEIEYMCGLEELEGTEGQSIKDMMKILERYCECASRKDYRLEIETLQELKNIITKSETKIRNAIDENCKLSASFDGFGKRKVYDSDYIDSNQINTYGDGSYVNGYGGHSHEWYDSSDMKTSHSYKWKSDDKRNESQYDENVNEISVKSVEELKENITPKNNDARNRAKFDIIDLELRAERYNKLAHLVNRCINLHRKLTLTEEIYMDIPVKEECEMLRRIKDYIEE